MNLDRYEIPFEWIRPPLTANDRLHHMKKAGIVRDIRRATGWKATAHRIPPLGRIRVELTWVVKDHRRRDGGENVAPTFKPMIDGLVDAGVVPDDTPDAVVRMMPTIRYDKDATPHFLLTITPLGVDE